MTEEASERWTTAWLSLVRTHARLWDRVESSMRAGTGLTMSRYDVLMQLDICGGRLGLSELAAAVVLTPSGLSKLLDRMEAAGLLTREPDPQDARSAFARITPRGRALVRKARHSHHALLQQAFGDALDDRDLADLSRVMRRIDARVSRLE
ncbi:MAG TPA: MarR family transcriptional regulator [Actinomycetes bacterium]|nr:MarR family transcriptional regulator [Actinomycetes bacterium]